MGREQGGKEGEEEERQGGDRNTCRMSFTILIQVTETGILYRKFQKRRVMDKRMKLGKFITANWRYPLSISGEFKKRSGPEININ